MKSIAFIDCEVGSRMQLLDLGAVKDSGEQFHAASDKDFVAFVKDCDFLCGHNIIAHDLKYLAKSFEQVRSGLFRRVRIPVAIDTLLLSPLLFPKQPYHALLKDDKLQTEELNNPLNDALKAQALFYDEVAAFRKLPAQLRDIYSHLLYDYPGYQGFFQYLSQSKSRVSVHDILHFFEGKICANAPVETLMRTHPVELAYALALVTANDHHSITPPWVLHNHPTVENILRLLRNSSCGTCPYCCQQLDVHQGLQRVFGFDQFRTYDGEPLQERAAEAAMNGDSLLAVFPTGGGKSLTFQLPAIMQGEAMHGLTVIISPLQSLMKDQVDNLEERGYLDAVTINGLLSPIERSEALRRVESGLASLLYISPEQLRSNTIERLLLKRNIVRFVIDEAHCFSAWGQDFRVDYLYIGPFIKQLQEKKQLANAIPVSCFTATAKQKVISDICTYFQETLNLELKLFTSTSTRKNLHYTVLYKESDEEKYTTLRHLVGQKNCATIVYVSRTKQTLHLAERMTGDGYPALPFNGKMEAKDKVANQEAFMSNQVKVIVATSAFGMGVDKKDVKLVVHYDISDSLENYIQEAGRAGRDESLQADCYVLFNENDLNKHFVLLNQTKLSMSEIQQVWKAVKELTRKRSTITSSALEIARQAGWDDSVMEIETRVRTALAALEHAGYIQRGKNTTRLYATSIRVKNMQEAVARISQSGLFDELQRENATRIVKSLISSKYTSQAGTEEAESRVDYLSDILGIEKEKTIEAIRLLRQAKVLADTRDLSAYIKRNDRGNKSSTLFKNFNRLESFLIDQLQESGSDTTLKELNELAGHQDIAFSSTKNLKSILHFWMLKGYIQKTSVRSDRRLKLMPLMNIGAIRNQFEERTQICQFLIEELYKLSEKNVAVKEEVLVQFSLISLWETYKQRLQQNLFARQNVTCQEVENALLYLSKMDIVPLEGGFMVLYNGMTIKKLIADNRIRYKVEDYSRLNEFYRQKIQQIHIVGEFANLMVRDYNAALQFVSDYFQMDYKRFLSQYFKGQRTAEISRNITPERYHKLFGELSEVQSQIIQDTSQHIVVAAGPGSGKTRVLVHKLASLLLMEDIKHEQLLMLTFSRAAATEFKQRLFNLIGNVAAFVEIKTFHAYCFDLLGKSGSLEEAQLVVAAATARINNGEAENGRITKSVLVIDEAQDMDKDAFALVEALMRHNEEMRVIAVGDDDQNIYAFRGSDSRYFSSLIQNHGAAFYELVDNYRSRQQIVAFANAYARTIETRMKSQPIRAIAPEPGTVKLIRHCSPHLEQPIVEHIAQNLHGSICVLTSTNDEALRVCALLHRKNINAQLIQSNEGFRLRNLVEMRAFLKSITSPTDASVIDNALWDIAKEKLRKTYAQSHCLPNVLNLLKTFENSNKTKYYSDFEEFINESQYEDFYEQAHNQVIVSTIHKSKGREFDTVYMLLNHVADTTDEERRKLYVGMTRAKEALYIHCNNGLFDNLQAQGWRIIEAHYPYEEPEELVLQLTFRDVFLDFFKDKKRVVFQLRSGDALEVEGSYLCANVGGQRLRIIKFARRVEETLASLRDRGYQPSTATIRFIVAWRGEHDDEESAVILPDIVLRRKEH